MSSKAIERLIQFGLQNNMIDQLDIPQVRNQIMSIMQETEIYTEAKAEAKTDTDVDADVDIDVDGHTNAGINNNTNKPDKEQLGSPITIINELLDEAVKKGIIEDGLTDRDILDAKIMAQMMPRQSELFHKFENIKNTKGIEAATDFYYKLSKDSNYIHMDRIEKNIVWKCQTEYGNLEITINLSKPEKDPKEIARARNLPSVNYPKCLLCLENVGFEGNLSHPARSNHRVIPVALNHEAWYFQYSPYVYYNEHAIVFKGAHEPMKISKESFVRLLDFVEQYPHYFLGSNADLPIVGGSILSHDHFQGGHHTFPMAIAPVLKSYVHEMYQNITIQMIKWPLSVIRLQGTDKSKLVAFSVYILEAWKKYSDAEHEIVAFTGQTPHNTITPIARVNGEDLFEIDLVLRNNRQNEAHPDGIFHPHQHLHHIKKENIGLIEVMGLAVLPPRLKEELVLVAEVLAGQKKFQELPAFMDQHSLWINELEEKYGNTLTQEKAMDNIRQEVGNKFSEVLECAGVFKMTETGVGAFDKFILSLGCR